MASDFVPRQTTHRRRFVFSPVRLHRSADRGIRRLRICDSCHRRMLAHRVRWQRIAGDKAWLEDDIVSKDPELYLYPEEGEMELVAKCKIFQGPVLGLSSNDLHPYWIATAAPGESICVHDISYPTELCKLTCELNDFGSVKEEKVQMTSLKWNKIYPTALAATSSKGTTKVWDLRAAKLMTAFGNTKVKSLSDLEFSWNNPMHLAVSTANNGTSAAVTVWDMRFSRTPYHEYSTGTSGVNCLSWNRSGQLLASHTDGTISCCDVYSKEMIQGLTRAWHGDLGVTWTHSENAFATLSSKYGVRLHEMSDQRIYP
ncbi:Protein transport protein SEC31 [Triticum urartu]|uniref:Protein transport protein SEC31 n=1 Tax=Triticum urartu TaxID=4572 RepID=M7Z816_TRIUA|nr:Protein transport protein SEC31 [Triticum urartu]